MGKTQKSTNHKLSHFGLIEDKIDQSYIHLAALIQQTFINLIFTVSWFTKRRFHKFFYKFFYNKVFPLTWKRNKLSKLVINLISKIIKINHICIFDVTEEVSACMYLKHLALLQLCMSVVHYTSSSFFPNRKQRSYLMSENTVHISYEGHEKFWLWFLALKAAFLSLELFSSR